MLPTGEHKHQWTGLWPRECLQCHGHGHPRTSANWDSLPSDSVNSWMKYQWEAKGVVGRAGGNTSPLQITGSNTFPLQITPPQIYQASSLTCGENNLSKGALVNSRKNKVPCLIPNSSHAQVCGHVTFSTGQFLVSRKQRTFKKCSPFLFVWGESMDVRAGRCCWESYFEADLSCVSSHPPTDQEDSTGLTCHIRTDEPAFRGNLKF